MVPLYTLTLFLSSALLFLVQPMVGKMILPRLGGTPAVWNTCMVFFQAVLLAGYLYSHLSIKLLGPRRQAVFHLVLLLVPAVVLPIALPHDGQWQPPSESNPIPWLLMLLTVMAGLPFFVISTSAPLIQKWFADTGHPAAHDPYFLYSASNFGSMIGLLGYPFVIEPLFPLTQQSWLWTGGYALLVLLFAVCAMGLWSSRTAAQPSARKVLASTQVEDLTRPSPTTGDRLRWVALSFVPSSLLLGVTTYLTTDLAAIPLLWVVPLALYLLSFIVVFASKPVIPHSWMVWSVPRLALLLLIFFGAQKLGSAPLAIPLHLLFFSVAALACHGELAQARPTVHWLTEYFLWISVGGVLGGLFNALLAPVLFPTVLEYPLTILLACLLMPRLTDSPSAPRAWAWDLALPPLLGAGWAMGMAFITLAAAPDWAEGIVYSLLAGICFFSVERPLRFGLGLGMLLLLSTGYRCLAPDLIRQERSFFGVSRVLIDKERIGDQQLNLHELIHGNTIHGLQNPDPPHRQQPLGYSHAAGPVGQIFTAFEGPRRQQPVAIIGLGAGVMASYIQPGQEVDIFEIDPAVRDIAEDPRCFTYLADCRARGGTCRIILGDGRLTLAQEPDGRYGFIFADAFSSDSVPTHLLTRQAIEMYRSKLAPGGVIVCNVSNRYLELAPVLGDVAAALHMVCGTHRDDKIPIEEQKRGRFVCQYVIMARSVADVGPLAYDPRWQALDGRPGVAVWEDDYTNLLSAIMRPRW